MNQIDDLLLRGLPVTLRQLQVFLAVCAEEGFSRAGERLGLTQPAVSAQVRQLEKAVDRRLVEFVGRTLWLTPDGEALRDAARDVLGRLDALSMQLDEIRGSVRGPLRLAVVSSAQYFLPHLLAAFAVEHPGVEVRVHVANRFAALERLDANADDLAIMALVPEERALELLPFLDNELHLVAAPDHRAAGARELVELTDACFLMRESGSGIRRALEDELDRRRVRPAGVMELGSTEAMREGARAGLGVALLPRHAIHRDLASGELVSIKVKGFPIRRSWCLVHARGKALNPAAERMKSFVQAHLGELPALLDAVPFPR
ncbi:MAG TPA: LysR family transcriptional regulator [Pseudomonadales bacterium]|nr:LysR family transcriptional regulator [Pseudomonadales bacterium]